MIKESRNEMKRRCIKEGRPEETDNRKVQRQGRKEKRELYTVLTVVMHTQP